MNKLTDEILTEEIRRLDLTDIHGVGTDVFLQTLVSMNNSKCTEMPVTLIVGGSIVSGVLIDVKQYFESIGKQLSTDEETQKAVAKYSDLDTEKNWPPQYIHLKNARFLSSTGMVPANEGVLWRGKVNAVSGFTFGKFSSK